jgi:hypothetical protein
MSLIEELRSAAAELVEGDTPTAAEARPLLGALVKWIEAEVDPKSKAKTAPAAAPAAAPASAPATPPPSAPIITTGPTAEQSEAAKAEIAKLQAHIAALQQDATVLGTLT